jgi:mannose-6-phosphate isomerase-like protein (cupin superfamily)|tara:strand:- start:82 stop:450 length:369 start_codon:yes stop_codon:yes gene_type:complete
MIKNLHEVIPEVAEGVRGGQGTVTAHKLLDLFPGSAIKSVGVVRLEPGASVGDHSHQGDEDFYYCLSGTGVVVDNGVEHPFTPGTLQITRSGESQAIRNTGETELVFLGALVTTLEIEKEAQ